MRRALRQARRGFGLTLPNPQVGAVLVRGRQLLGEGAHLGAGRPHAEVEAISMARQRGHTPLGATLYVTLEPCSTHGRTPPCTDLIRREKIGRVVYAATDPNPRHVGAARAILEADGIEVADGLLAEEATELNRDFNWWIVQRRPWVTAKIALSLDGRITTPEADTRWLTSPAARRAAQELRQAADAILVGGETVRRDNPRLTIRRAKATPKVQPWRVVWSRSERFAPGLHLWSDEHRERTFIANEATLGEVLTSLAKREIAHLLIEGGGQVLTAAFAAGLVNEIAFFIAPAINGTPTRALGPLPKSIRLEQVRYERVGSDLLCRARVGGLTTSWPGVRR